MSSEKLFVYGTLRKDFGLPLLQEISDDLRFVGNGKVEATLYDLGDYPGAIKGAAGTFIIGDVFDVQNAEKVLKILDEYEGDEYRREEVMVKMNDSDEVKAWIYWYCAGANEDRRIKHSDYLEYLKSKKDGFV